MSRVQKQISEENAPRRQARGQKRIEQLLKAAGEVFAEAGYDNATTNAIAAKAGVSPGTLYQFFPNKQAIAEALANQYATQNQQVHERAFSFDPTAIALPDLISRTIDPFLAFRQNAPGFDALFMGMFVSPELAKRVQMLHEGLKQRLAQLLMRRYPQASQKIVQECAEVCVQIVKGLMPLALSGSAEQRRRGAREMKVVIERYVAPIAAAAEAGKQTASEQRKRQHKN